MTGPAPALRLVLHTRDEAHTIAIGAALGRAMRPGDVVALHGELGAGKTRLVRGLARGMGLRHDDVHSPTFVLAHEHEAPGRTPLVHIDAYRLRGPEDLDTIGWDRIASGAAAVAVEWAERVAPDLPTSRLDVAIEHLPCERRRITLTGDAAWAGRLADVPWPA